jgi:hypothetical protein
MKLNLSRPVWWSATAVGVLGYLTLWPVEYRIPCLFHASTGLLCPGCGTTRSLTALIHGDVVGAFAFNPLIYFIPVFLIAYELAKRSKFKYVLNLGLAMFATFSTLGFFLVRNNFL